MSSMRTERKRDTKNGVKRLVFVALAVAIQIFWIYVLLRWLNTYSTWADMLLRFVVLVLVLYIYGRHSNSALKMPWLLLMMAAPLLGSILYLLMGRPDTTKGMQKRFEDIDRMLMPLLSQQDDVLAEIEEKDRNIAGISKYLWNFAGFPVYHDSNATYYEDAADAIRAQIEDLKKAKKFIFMEYHAIEDKESFAPIKEILHEKAMQGLDVRLFYDDVGSIGFLDGTFIRKMDELGIKTRVFNPVVPFVKMFMNNRDHRKITVIDGEVAYTGGYNLANEYFHLTQPYGYWKDDGIRLEGGCVASFTVMFLEMWNAISATDRDDRDFNRFFPKPLGAAGRGVPAENTGYIQPYADSPMDEEHTGENVYMNILNRATDYCYFITPYLIITDEMYKAFTLAAKRGVDVRIITPGIPDKRITYSITRSYYAELARGGVRIFEYTPGFCHAKLCVSDDKVATCGSINLDYRSLFHHFENGVFLYDNKAVADIRKDFDSMFPQCEEVTVRYRDSRKVIYRIFQCLLRLIAPLM
jgi:cardiolipin synthase